MGKNRDTSQIARDRRIIGDLYMQGWLQSRIAKKVGLNQSTISRDLKALHKEWLDSALNSYDQAKANELAKIDQLERTYWQEWERSCEDTETTAHKQKGKVTKIQNEDGVFVAEQPAEVYKKQVRRLGDPRYLQGVERCIERRCKILGLDAPAKQEIKIDDIGDTARIERIATIFDAARERRDKPTSG